MWFLEQPIQKIARKYSHSHGFGFVEVIISMAVLSIMIVVWQQQLTSLHQSQVIVSEEADLEDLRAFVRNNLDCQATLTAGACTTDKIIAGIGACGAQILSAPEALIGSKAKLRVSCGPTLGTGILKIEAKSNDNAQWENLFPHVPIKCASTNNGLDLGTCQLLTSGTRKVYYTSNNCPANYAVIVIDDGPNASNGDEMICCPLTEGVLSKKSTEVNVLRVLTCNADEVMTGANGKSPPKPVCTKISRDTVMSARVPATRVSTASATGVLYTIANSFPSDDACFCPEGKMMVSTGSSLDNTCSNQCVGLTYTPPPDVLGSPKKCF